MFSLWKPFLLHKEVVIDYCMDILVRLKSEMWGKMGSISIPLPK